MEQIYCGLAVAVVLQKCAVFIRTVFIRIYNISAHLSQYKEEFSLYRANS